MTGFRLYTGGPSLRVLLSLIDGAGAVLITLLSCEVLNFPQLLEILKFQKAPTKKGAYKPTETAVFVTGACVYIYIHTCVCLYRVSC